MVKIYKQLNNGEVGVMAECRNEDEYLSDLAEAIVLFVASNAKRAWYEYEGKPPDDDPRPRASIIKRKEITVELTDAELDAIVGDAVSYSGEMEYNMPWLIRNAFEVLCKYRGYKCDRVSERRAMFCGDSWPSTSETPVVEVG